MEIFVKKFQPEKYNDWINKKDIAPHPMDPPEVAKSKWNFFYFVTSFEKTTKRYLWLFQAISWHFIHNIAEVKLQSENPQEYAKLMASSLVKKSKGLEGEEKNGNDKDGKKFVRYNLYQHHQLANVLVSFCFTRNSIIF